MRCLLLFVLTSCSAAEASTLVASTELGFIPRDAWERYDYLPLTDAQWDALIAAYPKCDDNQSIGKPWRGSLVCDRVIGRHPRLQAQTQLVFSTVETIDALHAVADQLAKDDPQGPVIDLFDISPEGGGPSPWHRSHQSGRDVDLGYIYHEGMRPAFFDEPADDAFDLEGSWRLLDALLATKRVQMILVDWEVQAMLYEVAREDGKRGLGKVFQYPRPRGARAGIIRHYPNHRNHLHVRFRCPRGDGRCRR